MKKNSLTANDMRLIADLFLMNEGYVLYFSNAEFEEFIQMTCNVNIYDERWGKNGNSKGKRLRYFLRNISDSEAVKVLQALWECRETVLENLDREAKQVPDAKEKFLRLIKRLSEKKNRSKSVASSSEGVQPDKATFKKLSQQLLNLEKLEPQQRGYEFERFLKTLFDAHKLSSRNSYRLPGEQIDGRFVLGNDTYLLEAKWKKSKSGSDDLRSFNAKVEDKASWSRGLFISYHGFTRDGLDCFNGKSIVCMDGLDLSDMLERGLSFVDVINLKAQNLAESGKPFVPVCELDID